MICSRIIRHIFKCLSCWSESKAFAAISITNDPTGKLIRQGEWLQAVAIAAPWPRRIEGCLPGTCTVQIQHGNRRNTDTCCHSRIPSHDLMQWGMIPIDSTWFNYDKEKHSKGIQGWLEKMELPKSQGPGVASLEKSPKYAELTRCHLQSWLETFRSPSVMLRISPASPVQTPM